MKPTIELEEAILGILNKIRAEFPELIKYINEMPSSSSRNHSESITNAALEAYFNSLQEIYAAYATTHSSLKTHKLP